MTKGLEIRAQIDTENVKGLLLINGGAAVALLAFLPGIFDKSGYESFARAILWGLLIFQAGLVFAVVHNRLRRICSLRYEQHNYQPPPCEIFGIKLREPCICLASTLFMWLAVAAFVCGGVTVLLGGLESLDQRAKLTQKAKVTTPQDAKIPPNPTVERDAHNSSARPWRMKPMFKPEWVTAWGIVIYTLAFLVSVGILYYQLRAIRRQAKYSTLSSYWGQWVEIDKWFVDHPEFKPYFYHGKDVGPGSNDLDERTRHQLDSTAEMLLDSFANIYWQIETMETEEEKRVFRDYMRSVYEDQPFFRRYVDEHGKWYTSDFIRFIHSA